jgi:hypothetical protein
MSGEQMVQVRLDQILERDAEKIVVLKGEIQLAEQKLNAAVEAYRKAIHYDKFEKQLRERMRDGHNRRCWPDSDCHQCSYEPDADEIEKYLVENAEDFEVEGELVEAAAESPGTVATIKLVHQKKHDPDVCEVAECAGTGCLICMACGIKLCADHVGEKLHPCTEWRKLEHYMAA